MAKSPVTMQWTEVEPLARNIFRVWTSRGDLEWASTAWAMLGEAGLTMVNEEEAESDRFRARARLLILGRLYHTFANHAWEEGCPAEWLNWVAEDPELSDVDLLRRLSPEWYDSFSDTLEEDEPFPDAEFSREALEELVEVEYPSVLAALLAGYGGESALFVSLWLTRSSDAAGWRAFPDDVLDDVLNNVEVGSGKLQAWDWLTSGASL